MTRPILILAFLLGLTIPLKAQTATDLNEGSRISYDSATGISTLNWWGRAGMSYFVQCSEDLVNWSFVGLSQPIADGVAGINYETNAVHLFMRMKIESDPFNTDSDGDGMSDAWEALNGLDPFNASDAIDDSDGDGVPNIFEYKLGATDPQDADSKPAATFTVDPSVTVDAPPVYKKIQTAIAEVAPGTYASISIKPGHYLEDVIIQNRHVLLMAQADASPVILAPASSSSYAAIWIYGDAGDTTLSGLTLRQENPEETMQGIFFYGQNAATRVAVTNCVIQGFTSFYGSGMNVYQGQAWVTHCTLSGNTATGSGAQGIHIGYSASLRLRNSILWDSVTGSAPELAGDDATPDITVQSSIVRGGSTWGGTNTDPQLNAYDQLTAQSTAAINQGTPLAAATSASGVPAPGFDIHGEVRETAQPDIGADEFVDSDIPPDGLPDWWEMKYFENLAQTGTDHGDSDGLTNRWEYYFGFDPLKENTLGNGISDLWNALDQAGSLVGDGTWQTDDDQDGLTKIQELIIGSDPDVWDTFGTGMPDSALLDFRFLPMNGDWDGDGVTNLQELIIGTHPLIADTDGDGYQDGVDAFALNAMLHDPIGSDPSDTTFPVILLYEPGNAVQLP